jgi:hypothetical protein
MMGMSGDTFYRYSNAHEAGGVPSDQLKAQDDLAHGEIETGHPGYLGSQDTFYVGPLKGVGRVYL